MGKHYETVSGTFGLDLAILGPGIYKVFAPEDRERLKAILPLLDAAFEAGMQAGAPSPSEGTQPARSDKCK